MASRLFALFAVALAFAGCSKQAPAETPPSPQPLAKSFTLPGAIDAARNRFRTEDGAIVGYAELATARVTHGAVSVTRFERALHGSPLKGAPVLFESAVSVNAKPARWEAGHALAEDGTLQRRAASVTERWKNVGTGFEQSWAFDRADGEIVVKVAVRGAKTFEDDARGLPLQYGDATFVDANGRKTQLAAHLSGSEIVLRVPAELVAKSAFPAVLDPFVGAPVELDAPVKTRAEENQNVQALASNGTNFLLVWTDGRNPTTGLDVWGTLLDSSGVPVNPYGFPISVAPGNQDEAAVATDGADFFVVWTDARNEALNGTDIYGARVKGDGTVLDPQGVAIGAAGGIQQEPTIVYGAAAANPRYLVAWSGAPLLSNAAEIYGQRVLPDAGLLQAPFVISSATGTQRRPSAAILPNGTSALVVWQDDRAGNQDIYGAQVSITSTAANPTAQTNGVAFAVTTASDQVPGVTAGTSNFLLSWWQSNSDFRTLLLNGSTLADAGYSSMGAAAQFAITPVQSAFDGTNYHVLATRYPAAQPSNVAYARISGTTGGRIWGPDTLCSNCGAFAITRGIFNGAYAAWSVYRGVTLGNDIEGTTISPNASFPATGIDGIDLAYSANAETGVSSAWSGTNYLTAWTDTRADTLDIFGTTVSADGTPSNGPAIGIAVFDGGFDRNPMAAGGRGQFLVAATSNFPNTGNDVRLTVVNANGTLAAGPKLLKNSPTANVTALNAADDGQQFLLLFRDGTNALRLTHVDGQAQVQEDGGVLVHTFGTFSGPAAIAVGNGVALIAMDDTRSDPFTGVWARVDGGVAAVDPVGFPLGTADSETGASVASSGSNFLVSWISRATGRAEVRANVFTPFATNGMIDGGVILGEVGTMTGGATSAAFDGTRYVVLWERADGGTGGEEIQARWLDQNGAALQSGPVSVHQGAEETRNVRAASDGQGTVLVTFSEYTANGRNSTRAYSEVIRFRRALGSACTSNEECGEGFCTEGVCCDTACGNGDPNDCQACSVAQGASSDGTCTFLPPSHQCRAASTNPLDVCDAPEVCTGSDAACPPDTVKPAQSECRASASECDAPELCDGTSKQCPSDLVYGIDHVCRAAAGTCDAEERCDGVTAACPSDVLRGADTICRAAQSSCDVEEKCTGTSAACGNDVFERDGLVCTEVLNGTCRAGACTAEEQTTHYGLIKCGCGSADSAPLIAVAALVLVLFRRRRGASVLVALLVIGVSTTARAEDEKKLHLSFLGLSPGAGISVADAESVSNYVQSQLNALNAYDVLGPNDVRAIIGQERQKQLLGCTEEASSCLAEIAGALNADRAMNGDLAIVGSSVLLNLSLLDMSTQKVIKRVARRAEGNSPDALLDQVQGAVIELVSGDPALAGKKLTIERGFGGVMAGVRGDGDVVGRGFSPGVTAELSGKRFGGALTVLLGSAASSNGQSQIFPGLRAEARVFPAEFGIVRPYLAAGATVFAPDVAARGALGLAVRFGSLQLFADAAYERFFNARANDGNFSPDAVLLGAGAGWAF